MQIALFDLDHTLIPFDSGSLFTRHLASLGALDDGFAARYLEYCRRYADGTVDMLEMHRFTVGALGVHDPATLARWMSDFRATIANHVPPAALELVARPPENASPAAARRKVVPWVPCRSRSSTSITR